MIKKFNFKYISSCFLLLSSSINCAELSSEKTHIIQVGINYYGTDNQLNGCVNDIEEFFEVVCVPKLQKGIWNGQNFTMSILTDEPDYYTNKLSKHLINGKNLKDLGIKYSINDPSKKNIMQSITDAVNKVKEGSVNNILFQYSGHGGQTPTLTDYKESDGNNETLYTVTQSGTMEIIEDDWLKKNLVDRIEQLNVNKSPNVFCLVDACHSGTILDLPYSISPAKLYNCTKPQDLNSYSRFNYYYGSLRSFLSISPSLKSGPQEATNNIGTKLYSFMINAFGYLYSWIPIGSKDYKTSDSSLKGTTQPNNQGINANSISNIVCLSGCTDYETSADAIIKDKSYKPAQGALTYAFLESIQKISSQNLNEANVLPNLLKNIYKTIKPINPDQDPQISSNFCLDLNNHENCTSESASSKKEKIKKILSLLVKPEIAQFKIKS